MYIVLIEDFENEKVRPYLDGRVMYKKQGEKLLLVKQMVPSNSLKMLLKKMQSRVSSVST